MIVSNMRRARAAWSLYDFNLPAAARDSLNNISEIYNTRWEHWGARTATGSGMFTFGYGGLRAVERIYGLKECTAIDRLAYTRMKVSWQRTFQRGAWVAAGSHVFDVHPQGDGC